MFRRLDYQDSVINALEHYLDTLIDKKAQSDAVAKVAADNPGVTIPVPDFAAETWQILKDERGLPASRSDIPYSTRQDGCDRPVPNAVLKVPTGGGKTWLAVESVSRIMGRYIKSNSGFVLWVVPNEAIYRQTLAHLKNRDHPYRQALDRAAAGRVKILEKDSRLDARDVESHLCIMVLMLQSANRQTKETLKMFRDRGDVFGFTPDEGNQQAHTELRAAIPNLDVYDLADARVGWPMVKDSLGNALRIIRPVVVLDEAHKAISDLAYDTIYGFNPSFVLDLTATPKDVKERGGANPQPARFANVLVEVTGKELDREGMIKMPLNLDPRQGVDWKATLSAGLERLDQLASASEALRAETARYIRPIMLVQVERTGKETRDGNHIHADDVFDQLVAMGLDAAEIAIKTAEQNDLAQPENLDLLSPTNRVRVIITKQALQEGWDCPFAYVLCSLAANSNMTAMTQLIGRILRQPQAAKTGVDALDECYVITHHANTAEVVGKVKGALEGEGLGDLVLRVSGDEAVSVQGPARTLNRRNIFHSDRIYLPKVMIKSGDQVRELDYETDLLSALDWNGVDVSAIVARIPDNAKAANSQMQRFWLEDDGIKQEVLAASADIRRFDAVYAVRMISDLVPNPFVGHDVVVSVLDGLKERGFGDDLLGDLASLIIEELRKGLTDLQNDLAESLFRKRVADGVIQFRLRVDGRNWKMPNTMETALPEGSEQLLGATGLPLEKSLFDAVYKAELNGEEQGVAVHLDGDGALKWWHRNVARSQYSVQGWRKARIYPDFIFAVSKDDGNLRLVALETKGEQLDNLDTAYKRQVLDLMSRAFEWDHTVKAGELELDDDGTSVHCELVLMGDIPTTLPTLLDPRD